LRKPFHAICLKKIKDR